jgi:hypothetical protein
MRASRSQASRRVGLGCGLVCLALAVVTAWARADPETRAHGDMQTGRPPVEIYPTADRLPANLLRVYLVFDTAMSTGESRAICGWWTPRVARCRAPSFSSTRNCGTARAAG